MGDVKDIIIIGAGIAGASVGARLSPDLDMIMLDGEAHPGYHATGRSAAIYVPDHGPKAIRALTSSSLDFFLNPPEGFVEGNILSPRGFVFVARDGEQGKLEKLLADAPSLEYVDQKRLYQIMPGLADGQFIAGGYSEGTLDIDVDILHQGYLKAFKAKGGLVECNRQVIAIEKIDGLWIVTTKSTVYKTKTIINAAGAWGDKIGVMAGCMPIGLTPKKRTAAIIQFDKPAQPKWPMVAEINEDWYFRPAGEFVFVSPADEVPMEPCDAWADDLDVAMVVENVGQAIGAEALRVESSWAGLRSFTPDGVITIGFDSNQEGFFWLVGQGGYGIESSPSASILAASLIEGKEIPSELMTHNVDVADYCPSRFQKEQ